MDCEISMPEFQNPKTETASVLLVRLSILKTKGTTRFLGSRASKPTRFGGPEWPEFFFEFSSFSGGFRPVRFPASEAVKLGSFGLP